MEKPMPTLGELMSTLPQRGTVEWIGVRPGRREALDALDSVEVTAQEGLAGDRYSKAGGDRQVSLIQGEHLDAIGSMLGEGTIDPARVRRNIVVRGINLLALKDKQFKVGAATLRYTGLCVPCSHMEEALGAGGYNAMRGHGGITAAVVEGGTISKGSSVHVVEGDD
jgi:MOSC domain-containing protein YiiM